MPATVIDGKALAAATKAEAAEKVRELKSRGINPCLAVILVGENPASQVYVRGKISDCAQCGVESRSINLPADTTQDALLAEVKKLADDLCCARHSGAAAAARPDRREGCHRRHPAREGCGRLLARQRGPYADRRAVLPALHPAGCIRMIESTGTDIAGKNAVVIGRSNIVGKPAALPAAGEECHGHDLPLQDEEPERSLHRRGYSRGRRGPRGLCDRRHGQARCRRH